MHHNGTKQTAEFATEEQIRRELFAVAISWNKEAILCPSLWLRSVKLQQDSYGKLQCLGEDLVGMIPKQRGQQYIDSQMLTNMPTIRKLDDAPVG